MNSFHARRGRGAALSHLAGHVLSLLLLLQTSRSTTTVHGLVVGPSQASNFLFSERFRATCPADRSSIRLFDPRLVPAPNGDNDKVHGDSSSSSSPSAVASSTWTNSLPDTWAKRTTTLNNDVWVAVYRSSYLMTPDTSSPSSLPYSLSVREDFMQAMKTATSDGSASSDAASSPQADGLILQSAGSSTAVPVAVARLRPSDDYPQTWILDSMRCLLQKEQTDLSCDGGSEHTEALSVAVDVLLQYYLTQLLSTTFSSTASTAGPGRPCRFEGAVRTKATLVSGPLLEARGFLPVASLQRDMATHVSSLDRCMEQYAARSVSSASTSAAAAATSGRGVKYFASSPASRQRALDIVSHLGRLDRQGDLDLAADASDAASKLSSGDDSDYDPWASVKRFL